jgi:hypothetical protein
MPFLARRADRFAFTAAVMLCVVSSTAQQQPFPFAVPSLAVPEDAASVLVPSEINGAAPSTPTTSVPSSSPAAAPAAATRLAQVQQANQLLDQLNAIAQSVYRSVGLNPVGDFIDDAVVQLKTFIATQVGQTA